MYYVSRQFFSSMFFKKQLRFHVSEKILLMLHKYINPVANIIRLKVVLFILWWAELETLTLILKPISR